MANRTAKFVSAMAASVLAAPVILLAESAGAAPDDCLPGPKGATPQGQHWYYRLDRATKRQCWYLREAAGKTSHTLAPNASAAATTAPQQSKGGAHPLEDAHAEWPAPQTGNRPDTTATVPQQAVSTPVNPLGADAGQATAAQDTAVPQPAFGSRWPDASEMPASAATPLGDARPAPRAAPRVPGATPLAAAASDTAAETSSGSIRSLLMAMLGALALAGVIASIIYRFSARHRARQEVRGRRQVNWDAAAGSAAPPWTAKAEKDSLATDIMAMTRSPRMPEPNILSPKPLSPKPLSPKPPSSKPLSSMPLSSKPLSPKMPEPKDLESTSPATRKPEPGELESSSPALGALASRNAKPKLDQPVDAETDRITELLEQLIKQGPKLDRMIPARADQGRPAPSGARA